MTVVSFVVWHRILASYLSIVALQPGVSLSASCASSEIVIVYYVYVYWKSRSPECDVQQRKYVHVGATLRMSTRTDGAIAQWRSDVTAIRNTREIALKRVDAGYGPGRKQRK